MRLFTFKDFINERYENQTELVKKIQREALKPQQKMSLPYHLNDFAILALADDPNNSEIFAELMVNGDDICLEYGDDRGSYEICYNSKQYKTVLAMLKHAYSEWQNKIKELHLTEEDVAIDELSKSFV